MAIEVSAEPTPNPNALKITANQPLFEGSGSLSLKSGDESDHPLANALIKIEGVDNIFGMNDFVTINKTPDAEWDHILSETEAIFNQLYE